MSAAKHTPGPWFVPFRERGNLYVEAKIRPGWLQEVAACGPTEIQGQQAANARLIAAAPELLEALKGAVTELLAVVNSLNAEQMPHDGDDFHERLGAALAAIAKATGGQA
jgi:hypothetical protein